MRTFVAEFEIESELPEEELQELLLEVMENGNLGVGITGKRYWFLPRPMTTTVALTELEDRTDEFYELDRAQSYDEWNKARHTAAMRSVGEGG